MAVDEGRGRLSALVEDQEVAACRLHVARLCIASIQGILEVAGGRAAT